MSYKTFNEYIPSQSKWFDKIPKNWDIRPIKHLAKTIPGGTPSTSNLEYWENGNIPWLPSGMVQNCQIDETDAYKFITEKGLLNSATKYIGPNSILVALTGATCANIGYLTFKATANQSVISVEPYTTFPKYIYYALLSQREQILDKKTGGAQSGINEDDVKNIFIPTMDFKEQKQIANYLDQKTAKIDETIAKNEELIELLEEKRVALINQVVTKGLNPDVPMKDSGVEWIGEIPEHWDVVPFKRLFDNIKDGTHGSFQRVADGKPLLSAKNVFNDTINISENESLISQEDYNSIVANGFPKRNDLLLTIVGTIGRSCVYDKDFPLAFQRSVAFIRLTYDDPYFYNYFVKSDIFFSQLMINAKESAQKGVYLNDIKECLVIRPPIEIQSEIANYLQNHISKINKIISKIQENINLLEEYKTSLIHHVVTGKIDVRGEEI